jgi:hypothetical protein
MYVLVVFVGVGTADVGRREKLWTKIFWLNITFTSRTISLSAI